MPIGDPQAAGPPRNGPDSLVHHARKAPRDCGSRPWSTTVLTVGARLVTDLLSNRAGPTMADRVVVRSAAAAGMARVDLLGNLHEMTVGTGTSVDAAMWVGIGPSIEHPH